MFPEDHEEFQLLLDQKDLNQHLNWMLQKTVRDGSGKAAFIPNSPVAGKPGTSEGGRELWFIGSIPQLSTGVWLGYDDNRKTRRGSGEAAWIWKQYMLTIEKDFEILEFPSRR